ncbi:hypothetical protein V8D89_002067 [Ganoderma adspersum]
MAVDVLIQGYVLDGGFYRLFNASLPADPSHKQYGVPDDYEPLDLSDILILCGWVKTTEWALAAATHHVRDGEIAFGGDFGPGGQNARDEGTKTSKFD